MAYEARVFRFLIASPSDVEEEREYAVRAIQDWNDQHSTDRQIVLLPVRWETHSTPEYGQRPQASINRQLVDNCDALIGVFWTRLGSPTGEADSGTIEEIERVAAAGKPVRLYFSQDKPDLDSIDVDQLTKLRDFKSKIKSKALIESYSNTIEFRDKLLRHLGTTVADLIKSTSEDGDLFRSAKPTTNILLEYGDLNNGSSAGARLDLRATLVEVPDFKEIPDYTGEEQDAKIDDDDFGPAVNTHYYRQTVEYFCQAGFFRPLRFWHKNEGAIGARDVEIDLDISSSDSDLELVTSENFNRPQAPTQYFGYERWRSRFDGKVFVGDLRGRRLKWNIALPALQPQREVCPPAPFMIGTATSTTMEITARIYADLLSVPVQRRLTLTFQVDRVQLSYAEILKRMKVPLLPRLSRRRKASVEAVPE